VIFNELFPRGDAMTELLLYKELAGAIGAAGDAVTKIVDGIKHLVVTGVSGYDYVAAARERNQLVEISARATNLQARHQARVVRDLDEYLNKPNPNALDWYAVKEGITYVMESMKELLDDVGKERSDFVLEAAYAKLLETTSARVSLLSRVSSLPPPSSIEEKDALRQLSAEYRRLLSAFREAIEQLNLYLKAKK
jgi:hypothetical protein